MMKRLIFLSLGLLLLAAQPVQAAKKSICGNLIKPGQSGPWDYRLGQGELSQQLGLVEMGHYTAEVEAGIRGYSTADVGGDLHYTLTHFPNHHRALATLAKVALRRHLLQLPGADYPVECYYDRAIRWTPDDPAVYSLYGSYLTAVGRNEEALPQFAQAVELMPDDATYNYNYGLSLFKAKRYDEANKYAHKAYAQAFPLPGLKNMLVGAGKWQDVPEETPAQSAQAAPQDGPADEKAGGKQQ